MPKAFQFDQNVGPSSLTNMLLSFLRELLVPFEFPEVIAQLEIFMFSRLQAVLRGIKFFSQRTRTFKKKNPRACQRSGK